MTQMASNQSDLAHQLLTWFDAFGRKNLPWQHPKDPYRIWVSEIMLQQTQVITVIPYFNRFMASFPDIAALARASLDDVLVHWAGLGYYSRARNLHKAASMICNLTSRGLSAGSIDFPNTFEALIQLPGIGKTTAHAILSLAFNHCTPILDGNVKRVLSRVYEHEGDLWTLAYQAMATNRCAQYTQAIMDLGATICTRSSPRCTSCPLSALCLSHQHGTIAQYPPKKARKLIPTESCVFVVYQRNTVSTSRGLSAGSCDDGNTPDPADKPRSVDMVYLIKQPETGLWGGLWCLPKYASLDALPVKRYRPITAFTHAFTHFKLGIEAVLVTDVCELAGGDWFCMDEALSLALPKPIKTILTRF